MNLKKLHEAFIEKANRPMTFGALPIAAKEPEAPIMATNRWRDVDGALVKQYMFRRAGDRDRFMMGLLDYEREVQHHATIVIDADTVTLKIITHDVDRATELDREYARFADVLFRDVVYDPGHGTEGIQRSTS
jgi:pterin-4a-carbinolamine dehydratase